MVATDIAARGIDVAGVTPCHQLRRAGEPGGLRAPDRPDRARAGGGRRLHARHPGGCPEIRDIQRFIGQKIPELRLAGFNYLPFTARPPQPAGAGGGRGGRQPGENRPRGNFNRFNRRRG